MSNSLPTFTTTHLGIITPSISKSVNPIVCLLSFELKSGAFYMNVITGNSWTAIFFLSVICLSMCPSICLCISVEEWRLHKNCSRAGFISHLPRIHLWWDREALTPEVRTKEGPFFPFNLSSLCILRLSRSSARLPQSIFSAFFLRNTFCKMILFHDADVRNALRSVHKRTVDINVTRVIALMIFRVMQFFLIMFFKFV